ncbi:galanin receptor 2a-like [Ptychodera flava]|uniref:galanin receptor 2a-like n=1 Tax=Ptychodera flava TaxID=63121 RepID=UPI00396A6693
MMDISRWKYGPDTMDDIHTEKLNQVDYLRESKCFTEINDTETGIPKQCYLYDENFLYDNSILLTRILPGTIVYAVGIIVNVLFLFVVFRAPSMRTVTNRYLSNLAIVNTLFLTLYYIEHIGEPLASDVVNDKSYLGDVGCTMVNYSLMVCLFTAQFVIVAFTTERYLAICHPFRAHRISSKSRTFTLIALTWLLGILFSVPFMQFYVTWFTRCIDWELPDDNTTTSLPNTTSYCWAGTGDLGQQILYSWFPVSVFILVLIIVAVLNTLTVRELRRNARQTSSDVAVQRRRIKHKKQVVIMLAVTALVFFICLFPYHLDLILTFYNSIKTEECEDNIIQMGTVWEEIVRWLPMANASLNPLIYWLISVQYRTAFKQTFCCKCQNSTRIQSSNISLSVFEELHTQTDHDVRTFEEETEICTFREGESVASAGVPPHDAVLIEDMKEFQMTDDQCSDVDLAEVAKTTSLSHSIRFLSACLENEYF